MKKSLIALCLILVLSCSEGYEVSDDKLVERQGIKYEINSTVPFTGIEIADYGRTSGLYRTEYKDGKKDGFWEKYYSNGNLDFRYENFYENGEIAEDFGDYEAYYKNGQLKEKIVDDYQETYFENGQLKSRYDFSGSLRYETYYRNGQLQSRHGGGSQETYHPNGQLKSRVNNNEKGEPEGLAEEFDENGNLIATEEYKAGELVN